MASDGNGQTALTLRLPIELHERLSIRSLIEETSINELILQSIYRDERNGDVRIEAIRKIVGDMRAETRERLREDR